MATAEHKEEMKYTKYEKAKIIGTRALQISQGAPFLIKLSDKELQDLCYDPVAIAKKEFEAGVIQLDVVRQMPRKSTRGNVEQAPPVVGPEL